MSTTPSLSKTIWPRWASRQFLTVPIVQTLLPVTFGYSLSSEPVIMRQLRRWKRLWRRLLTRSHKRTSMGPSRSCWNDTSALQPEFEVFHVCTINKSVHTKKRLESYWKHHVHYFYLNLPTSIHTNTQTPKRFTFSHIDIVRAIFPR